MLNALRRIKEWCQEQNLPEVGIRWEPQGDFGGELMDFWRIWEPLANWMEEMFDVF
jgi:hypothetical protein